MATYIPRSSMDYVEAAKKKTAASTKAQKVAAFNQIKQSAADQTIAMNKIGQGFIGPVMMRLKYEGIVRNILTEDPIPAGTLPVYDVADEMGKAYFLEPYQAEVMISQYEGKRVPYGFRHLAAYATVQEQDFLELSFDISEYAISEAQQRIQEQEDGYLFQLIEAAIAGITTDFAGLTAGQHRIPTGSTTNPFAPADFYNAAGLAAQNRLDAKNIVMNAADYFDILKWDLVATSVEFKGETFAGVPVTSFAGFNVFRSVLCTQGTAYVLPDADFVGRFPVRKSLEIRSNDKLEAFMVGWVLDEYINELILNSNGLFKVIKAAE